MNEVNLAKLTRVENIREVWPHERYDFPAWLLDNGDALADVLDIELEFDQAEEPVGEFSLDLIGRDLTNGTVLLAVTPSDWQRRIREKADASRLTGKARLYVDFWDRFIERVRQAHPGWTKRGPGVRPDNWLDLPSGISGTYIAASFARGSRMRHELYIGSSDAEQNLSLFHALESQRDALEQAYGRPLTFEELPDKAACRIAEYHEDADVTEVDRHDEFIDWFFDAGERLRRALGEVALP